MVTLLGGHLNIALLKCVAIMEAVTTPTARTSSEALLHTDNHGPDTAPRWSDAKLLPGALRLLQHLASHNIPFAIATSTPRATFDKKMSKKPELRALLKHVVCGDEVGGV